MNPDRTTPRAVSLDRRWAWLLYPLAFVPVVGIPMVIMGSFASYYALRRRAPEVARRINVHAWCARGVAVGVRGAWWFLRRA